MIQNIEKEVDEITKWVKDIVTKSCADGVVIGNSGGKDCATVIAIAQKALGKEKVLSVFLPCHSIATDGEDAKLIADTFEVPLLKIDLTRAYDELTKVIEQNIVPKEEWRMNEARVNTKPRLRMTTLYNIAQQRNYLVMGTGNLCESIVGYTTKWGDNASDFNPIGEFTVEEVYQLANYLGVPQKIIQKAPNDGLGGLTDEEKLGVTYQQITEYIETGKTEENAMKIIMQKERASEHKRNQIPVYHRIKNK